MENKKIALVTCYFQPNYGSQLQAYATQMAFDKLGIENETIRIDGLRPEINKAKYKYFLSRIFNLDTVKDKMATVRKFVARKRNKQYARNLAERIEKFNEFANTRFRLSRQYNSKAELSAAAHNYQAFVVGSDQLWLPSNIAADYYTLNFVPDDVCKIALSTSFGISQLPRRQAELAKKFLPRFNHLSIREKSGQKLIKDLTGIDVPVVCDPTLLFDSSDWDSLMPKGNFAEGKYVFCYFLGNNPQHRIWARKFADANGCRIIQMQHCDEYIKSDEDFPDEAPYNVGPFEFIQLIRNAEYVMTDSFHCTVFSMLYRKNFFAFRRYNNDGITSTNGRLYSLLSMVSLGSRLLTGEEPVDSVKKSIDTFDEVHTRLQELRDFTWQWLKNAVSAF